MDSVTTDALFDGKLMVHQHRSGYRFSEDALILARQARMRDGDLVVDLGTGCGIIPLVIAFHHPGARVVGVEIQESLAGLAMENIRLNRMEDTLQVICADMTALDVAALPGIPDLVICNPPYRQARAGRINPDRQRAIARHEIMAGLEEITDTANRLLKASGRFITMYPAWRLVEVLNRMAASGMEPKSLRMIHSKPDSDARLFLVQGVKGGKPGITIESPIMTYEKDGSLSEEMRNLQE